MWSASQPWVPTHALHTGLSCSFNPCSCSVICLSTLGPDSRSSHRSKLLLQPMFLLCDLPLNHGSWLTLITQVWFKCWWKQGVNVPTWSWASGVAPLGLPEPGPRALATPWPEQPPLLPPYAAPGGPPLLTIVPRTPPSHNRSKDPPSLSLQGPPLSLQEPHPLQN